MENDSVRNYIEPKQRGNRFWKTIAQLSHGEIPAVNAYGEPAARGNTRWASANTLTMSIYGTEPVEITRSKLATANGRDSPAACQSVRPGKRSRAAATRAPSISTPVTSSQGTAFHASRSRPSPQPRSRTRIRTTFEKRLLITYSRGRCQLCSIEKGSGYKILRFRMVHHDC